MKAAPLHAPDTQYSMSEETPFPFAVLASAALVILVSLSCAPTHAAESQLAPRKKFIELGWGFPDTSFLRQHWQEMERTALGLMIRWQRADGSWVRWDADATFTFSGSREGWTQAFGVVSVPDHAGKLVILLKAEHQLSDADACWFDNVALYRMEGAPCGGVFL